MILDIFALLIIQRMNNSFRKYQYTINMKYAEKGEYIFPYDEIDNKSYDIVGPFFYFLFLILYNLHFCSIHDII